MARVLVIEDEADLQEILRYNLGQAGHGITKTENRFRIALSQ